MRASLNKLFLILKYLLNQTNGNVQIEKLEIFKMNYSELFKLSEPIHKNKIRIINMNI